MARRNLLEEFELQLGTLSPRVTIRLYARSGSPGVEFEQSHFIQTPAQVSAYRPSRPWGDDAAYARSLATSSLQTYYDDAMGKGHAPHDSWLVRNERFGR